MLQNEFGVQPEPRHTEGSTSRLPSQLGRGHPLPFPLPQYFWHLNLSAFDSSAQDSRFHFSNIVMFAPLWSDLPPGYHPKMVCGVIVNPVLIAILFAVCIHKSRCRSFAGTVLLQSWLLRRFIFYKSSVFAFRGLQYSFVITRRLAVYVALHRLCVHTHPVSSVQSASGIVVFYEICVCTTVADLGRNQGDPWPLCVQ